MATSEEGALGIADRIEVLRLKAKRSEGEMAVELGLTPDAYRQLEQHDSELESSLSLAQALQLATLLGASLLGLLGEAEQPMKLSITKVRTGLAGQLGTNAEAREALQDVLDWDLGPFLDGGDEWLTVYTLEFIHKLAVAIDVDWRVLVAGIGPG